MRYILTLQLVFIFLTSCFKSVAQRLEESPHRSHYTYLYKVPVDTAIKMAFTYTIADPTLSSFQPIDSCAGNCDFDSLPVGHYLRVNIVETELKIHYFVVTNLMMRVLTDAKKQKLIIRTKAGEDVTNAVIIDKRKKIRYNTEARAYLIKPCKEDLERFLIIQTPEEKVVYEYTGEEDDYDGYDYDDDDRYARQRSFRRHYAFEHREQQEKLGYVVFNKPRYASNDTVRFKAHLLKLGKKPLNVYANLGYSHSDNNAIKVISNLKPESKGIYHSWFVLNDSFELDRYYTLSFKTQKGKKVKSAGFSTEDYLLDKSTSVFTIDKKALYFNDSVEVTAYSKDYNGLYTTDARIEICATTRPKGNFIGNNAFVPDTLFVIKKPLSSIDATKFFLPFKNMPAADISIELSATIFTGNNEQKTFEENIDYYATTDLIRTTIVGDSIFAHLFINGINTIGSGQVEIANDYDDEFTVKKITYPFKEKIDPFATDYYFRYDTSLTEFQDIESEEANAISINKLFTDSTIIIFINNHFRIPIYYSVFKGKNLIKKGYGSTPVITDTIWSNSNSIYTIDAHYVWGGETYHRRSWFSKNKNILSVKLQQDERIYPGQKDTIHVDVRDSKGKPLKNTPITALSYNKEFNAGINIRYSNFAKNKPVNLAEYSSESEIVYFTKNYPLRKYPLWIPKFHLDTSLFYSLIFPKRAIVVHTEDINNGYTEVAPFIIENGEEHTPHLVWIDQDLVHFSGNQIAKPYSFPTTPGYHSIIMRTANRKIVLDSLYLPAKQKTIVVFNYDSLAQPKEPILPYFYEAEKTLLLYKLLIYNPEWNSPLTVLKQSDRVFLYVSNSPVRMPLVGPFSIDSVEFISPYKYSLTFKPEKEYIHAFSPKIMRLEKTDIRGRLNYKLEQKSSNLFFQKFADKFMAYHMPVAGKEMPKLKTYILNPESASQEKGRLFLKVSGDSTFNYVQIFRLGSNPGQGVYNMPVSNYYLAAGIYRIELVTAGSHKIVLDSIVVKPYGTNFYHITYTDKDFQPHENFWIKKNTASDFGYRKYHKKNNNISFAGKLVSENGDTLGNTALSITNESTNITYMVYSSNQGIFSFSGLPAGNYLWSGNKTPLHITIHKDSTLIALLTVLNEPIVEVKEVDIIIPYSERKLQKELLALNVMTLSAVDVRSVSAGYVETDNSDKGADSIESISGARMSVLSYYVDGVKVSGKPIITGYEAADQTQVEGSNKVRSNFKDYGFWIPNLTTDENGKASFKVTYPDNITAWQSYIVALNKKKKFGIGSATTKAYNDVSANLTLPQFILEGDSATAYIKMNNYTNNSLNVNATFAVNNRMMFSNKVVLNKTLADKIPITANNQNIVNDSLKVLFAINLDNGFTDGEERKVQVYPVGTEETKGVFVNMQSDTTVIFNPNTNWGNVTIHAETDILNILIDEIENLKNYPHSCIEQTASKLIAVTMREKIDNALGRKFKDARLRDKLIDKLQKAQLYNGGFGWWESTTANPNVTRHVLTALYNAGALDIYKTKIDDALYFLWGAYINAHREDKLRTLQLFAEVKYQEVDVAKELAKIPFDSLSLLGQLSMVKIETLLGIAAPEHWNKILAQKRSTTFGGSYWGDDIFVWYRSQTTATIQAYQIAEMKGDEALQNSIIQYLLEKRRHNGWYNTAESAIILSAILPKVLKNRSGDISSPQLKISGIDEPVKTYPFSTTLPANNTVSIAKSGSAPVYLTAYQKTFISNPDAVNKDFEVETHFERSTEKIQSLLEGSSIDLITTIKTKKQSEFVMIEIPIPAGCTYNSKYKGYSYSEVHREHYKNKVLIFCEQLNPGTQTFTVKLQSRYLGTYNLNPAKVELMYYPTFFGRTGIKKVKIVPQP